MSIKVGDKVIALKDWEGIDQRVKKGEIYLVERTRICPRFRVIQIAWGDSIFYWYVFNDKGEKYFEKVDEIRDHSEDFESTDISKELAEEAMKERS